MQELVDVVLEKTVKKFGRSSHVILPVGYRGQRVRIIVPKQLNLKEEIIEHLLPYTENIVGVYLIGSYARGEQTMDSDIDILVVTDKSVKISGKEKFHITAITADVVRDAVKNDPLSVYPIITEAQPILNPKFLEELRRTKPKPKTKWYLDSTATALGVVKAFLDIEKDDGNEFLEADSCIYSMFLRLRTMYLMDCLKRNRRYTNRNFLKAIKGVDSLMEMYQVYRAVRDERPAEYRVRLEDTEKLYDITKRWLREARG